jgi:hypothetical protein
MRRSFAASLILILFAGCGQPAAPALLPGDVVRPQIAYAPKAPWSAGAKVALGLLLEVHRPGRDETAFLGDGDVRPEQAVMRARLTFLNGDESVGEPLELPFVKDC